MRILVISDRYPPYYDGGYELVCENKVKGLEGKGHAIHVLTSSHGIDKPKRERNVLRLLHPLKQEDSGKLSRRILQVYNAFFGRLNYYITRDVLRETKPDLVYFWRMGNVSIFPLIAVHDCGKPAAFEIHDYWLLECKKDYLLEGNWLKKIYRNFLFGANYFKKLDLKNLIVISDALKASYVQYGFNEDSFFVIPNGVRGELVLDRHESMLTMQSNDFKLVYAGRIVREKGVHVAIEAVDHLVNELGIKNVSLEIIGNGNADYLQELDQSISSRKLQRHVTRQNQLTHKALLKLIGKYDCFLFTSIWDEPFGLTIIEAMSRGVPVIASNVGAVSEIIADRRNGLLVAPADAKQIADSVRLLMEDLSLRKNIQMAGIETVAEKFTIDKVVDRTEKYLLGLTT